MHSLDLSVQCWRHTSTWTPGASQVSQANVELLTPCSATPIPAFKFSFSHTPLPMDSIIQTWPLHLCSPALCLQHLTWKK